MRSRSQLLVNRFFFSVCSADCQTLRAAAAMQSVNTTKRKYLSLLLQFININTLLAQLPMVQPGCMCACVWRRIIITMKNRLYFVFVFAAEEMKTKMKLATIIIKMKHFLLCFSPLSRSLFSVATVDAVKVQRVTKKIKMNYLLVMNCHCG